MAKKNSRIRVLFTIPNFETAGSGKALLNIVIRLDKNEYEAHIMCTHRGGSLFRVVESSGIPLHVMEYTTPMRPLLRGLRRCAHVAREFKKINPDIIHSFHYAPDYSEALAAKIAGVKWVYTKKNMNWGGTSKNAWKLRSWLADAIVVQNSEMIHSFFPTSKKLQLIPRGVNCPEFADQLNSDNNAKLPHKILLNVSNLVPVKGVEIILKAMCQLNLERKWPIILRLVGDDNSEYAGQLKSWIIEWELTNQVVFMGKQAEVAREYTQADVFILSSYKESSPVALLEAMAAGTPVLSSNTAGAREIMGDFAEQLFEVGDYKELAGKIKWLLSIEQKELRLLINRQRERVESRHTIEGEVRKHESMYTQIR